MSKTVLSGMQPSGILHLGNYIGGILNWKSMIAKNPDYEYYFMIADLHSLTSLKNGDVLRKNIIDCAICYYACGIDFTAENITLFRQSKNPNHAELAWILQTITPVGWMERMTQFKDKKSTITTNHYLSVKENYIDFIIKTLENSDIKIEKENLVKIKEEILETLLDGSKFYQGNTVDSIIENSGKTENEICAMNGLLKDYNEEVNDKLEKLLSFDEHETLNKINTGLFTYPALMAADILLYNADFVPVGDDQKQHIELARDIAMRFNREYKCDIFKEPQPIITTDTRIMSLSDGSKKMSKSDPSEASRILLTDSDDEIIKKISRAKTDSIMGIYYDKENRSDISNLIRILACLSNKSNEYISNECKNLSTKQFKDLLASKIIETISPIREKIKILKTDSNIEKILQNGTEKSKLKSENCMKKVRSVIGI